VSDKQFDVDVRGLSCPEPVIRTKQFLSTNFSGQAKVIADSRVSVENVTRMAKKSGFVCNVTEQDGNYLITISKQG